MNNITMSDARENFSELVNRVAFGKERVSLTRKDKPMVVMVPIEDINFLEMIEEKYDMKQIELAIDEMELTPATSWNELKAEMGI